MTKQQAIKKLWGYIKREELVKIVSLLASQKPNDEGIQLLNAVINLTPDPNDVWFSALAILCKKEKALAGKLLQTSAAASGHPINNLTKAQLIDAIASGSKLTKADAG